jgi:hypothetical protein
VELKKSVGEEWESWKQFQLKLKNIFCEDMVWEETVSVRLCDQMNLKYSPNLR